MNLTGAIKIDGEIWYSAGWILPLPSDHYAAANRLKPGWQCFTVFERRGHEWYPLCGAIKWA